MMNKIKRQPKSSMETTTFVYALGIFTVLVATYMLTYGGIFVMVDEWYHASWGQDWALNFPQKLHTILTILTNRGPIKAFYASLRFPYLATLAFLYRWAQLTQFVGTVHAMGLANIPATALTAVLVFLTGIELEYRPRTSAVIALIYGLATPAWFYSKVYLREPIAALFLMAGMYFLVRFGKRVTIISLLLSILSFFLSALTRRSMVAVLPFAVLYAIVTIGRTIRNRYDKIDISRNATKKFTLFAALTLTGALFAYLGYLLTKTILLSYWGYLKTPLFFLKMHGEYGKALLVLTVSPARGLLIYSPTVLVSIWGAYSFIKKHPMEAAVLYPPFLGYLLALTHYCCYWGGWGWTSRYLIPFLPFLAISMITLVDSVLDKSRYASSRLSFSFIVLLALSIQILGVATLGPHTLSQIDPKNPSVAFSWKFLPFVWQYINKGHIDPNIAWTFLSGNTSAKIIIATGNLLLALITVKIVYAFTSRKIQPYKAVLLIATILLILVGLTMWSLKEYYLWDSRFKAQEGQLKAIEEVKQKASKNDILIEDFWIEAEYGYFNANARLMEFCKGDCPFTTVIAREEWKKKTEQEKKEWLERIAPGYRRIWFIPTNLPPASQNSIVEKWLDLHIYNQGCRWSGKGIRLCTYYKPDKETRNITFLKNVKLSNGISIERGTLSSAQFKAGKIIARSGSPILVSFSWSTARNLEARYKISLQLIDIKGAVRAQLDREPVDGFYPTTSWKPGRIVIDNYAFSLPKDLQPGDYRFIIVMYNTKNQKRLFLKENPEQNFIELPVIEIRKKEQ